VHVHQGGEFPEYPQQRDFNDERIDPIVGSSGEAGGSPILGTPKGPMPSRNGAGALSDPIVEEVTRLASRGVEVPV
jgi:hypothetical protein